MEVDGDSESRLNSLDGELSFFKAISRARPIGIHRHFHMLSIQLNIQKELSATISADDIWKKLRSCYDLDQLERLNDESDDDNPRQSVKKRNLDPEDNLQRDPFFASEFQLPWGEFDALFAQRRASSTSPPASLILPPPPAKRRGRPSNAAKAAAAAAAAAATAASVSTPTSTRGRGSRRASAVVGPTTGDHSESSGLTESEDEAPPANSVSAHGQSGKNSAAATPGASEGANNDGNEDAESAKSEPPKRGRGRGRPRGSRSRGSVGGTRRGQKK